MNVQEAVEVLKRATEAAIGGWDEADTQEERQALATLEGLNIYASKFKVGDFVFVLHGGDSGAWQVYKNDCKILRCAFTPKSCTFQFDNAGIQGWRRAADCFQTRSEAEAECSKRNGVES